MLSWRFFLAIRRKGSDSRKRESGDYFPMKSFALNASCDMFLPGKPSQKLLKRLVH